MLRRNERIKLTHTNIVCYERSLYKDVIDKDNHMNECQCNDNYEYSFINTIDSNEITEFCLNCGGYIEL